MCIREPIHKNKKEKIVLEIVLKIFEIVKQASQMDFFGKNYFNTKILLVSSPKSSH